MCVLRGAHANECLFAAFAVFVTICAGACDWSEKTVRHIAHKSMCVSHARISRHLVWRTVAENAPQMRIASLNLWLKRRGSFACVVVAVLVCHWRSCKRDGRYLWTLGRQRDRWRTHYAKEGENCAIVCVAFQSLKNELQTACRRGRERVVFPSEN